MNPLWEKFSLSEFDDKDNENSTDIIMLDWLANLRDSPPEWYSSEVKLSILYGDFREFARSESQQAPTASQFYEFMLGRLIAHHDMNDIFDTRCVPLVKPKYICTDKFYKYTYNCEWYKRKKIHAKIYELSRGQDSQRTFRLLDELDVYGKIHLQQYVTFLREYATPQNKLLKIIIRCGLLYNIRARATDEAGYLFYLPQINKYLVLYAITQYYQFIKVLTKFTYDAIIYHVRRDENIITTLLCDNADLGDIAKIFNQSDKKYTHYVLYNIQQSRYEIILRHAYGDGVSSTLDALKKLGFANCITVNFELIPSHCNYNIIANQCNLDEILINILFLSNKLTRGYVYKIISEETSKIYVGSTIKKPEKRFREHKSSYNTFMIARDTLQVAHDTPQVARESYCSSYEILKYNDARIVTIAEFHCSEPILRRYESWYICNLPNTVNISQYQFKQYPALMPRDSARLFTQDNV